jgi:RimJ/RimL family protein N-acetyltransferase
MFPKRIETDRLIMKKPERNCEFIEKLYSICSGESGERITKFMSWNPHSSIRETESIVDSWVNEFENGESINYMLIEKDKDRFIGMGGLSTYWDRGYGQLGCWLIPEVWGNGFSSERALTLNFEYIGLEKLQVRFDKENEKCHSCVSSYMSEVNGKKVMEYEEYVGSEKRRTLEYGVSNIHYKNSGGLEMIEDKTYSEVEDFFE